MFKHYLKVSIRILFRQKIYTGINITGLAIGVACCILILLYIHDELSYDRFHDKADRIYRVTLNLGGPVFSNTANTPTVLAPKLKAALPEIANFVRLSPYDKVTVAHGEKRLQESRFFLADPSVFEIFSFKLLRGNQQVALKQPHSVVISETAAHRYFGNEDPVGQELEVVDKGRFVITGIMQDMPVQSHFHADFLASLSSEGPVTNPWLSWGYTYILLPENISAPTFERKMNAIAGDFDYLGWGIKGMKFGLQPLTKIHLHSHLSAEIEANGDIRYVYLFSALALMILLTAWVNYMNMATARSIQRAQEVGIRKVVGSKRWNLIIQFLGEAVLLSCIAVLLAFILIESFLPFFNELAQKQLTFNLWKDAWLVVGGLGLALFSGLAAGSYPAFYLSSFQPLRILKGMSMHAPGAASFRRFLVLMQFAGASALMTGTVVIYKQLDYIRNKKLGFDKDHVIVLHISGTEIKKQYAVFKNELLKHPAILGTSAASGAPIEGYALKSQLGDLPLQYLMVDADYVPLMGLKIAAGRNFSREYSADTSAFLLNEAAVQALGWQDPIGRSFSSGFGRKTPGPVVGVVINFHNRSLHAPIEPTVFQFFPRYFNTILVKIAPYNISQVLKFLENTWEKFDPHHAFEYSFLDEDIDRLYRSEQRIEKFFFIFSSLAIFIACLGLFGLASFSAERRTKEHGIRKVLGATVVNLVALLSKDFLKLVLLANVVAWPIAWWAMNRWLQNFAYRISIEWWVFALAGGLALVIALLT
ncbi:MAG: ABC transporter permease, partial [Calditrichaeota bacterium]